MMRAQALQRALEGVLLAASSAAAAGCCDLTGGLIGSVPGHFRHLVLARAPAGTPVGELDGAACSALCGAEVASCRAATTALAWETRAGHLMCLARPRGELLSREYVHPIPRELRGLDGAALDARLREPGACEHLCFDELATQCSITPPVAPPPAPDERYVVCDVYRPSQCPDWFHLPSGRAPSRLPAPGRRARSAGELFAQAAYYEEASIGAFEECAGELTAFGAPPALVRRARAAARDERRHAASSLALAKRFGGAPCPSPRRARPSARSLAAFAAENAVAGCIGETFGALFAVRQAASARDEVVRRTLAVIARDEVRHAALAWAIHRWCVSRLPPRDRARVAAAQRQSLRRWREAPPFFGARVAAITGLPEQPEALRLAAAGCDLLATLFERETRDRLELYRARHVLVARARSPRRAAR